MSYWSLQSTDVASPQLGIIYDQIGMSGTNELLLYTVENQKMNFDGCLETEDE